MGPNAVLLNFVVTFAYRSILLQLSAQWKSHD